MPAALQRKQFEGQLSEFLEAATECGADELARERRVEAKVRLMEARLIAEEREAEEGGADQPTL